ncbi:hypothetical protein C357_17168 [Citreicella sp. 357]|nr:hypothetical protein C357_17168 [Citreicella sp. 357]
MFSGCIEPHLGGLIPCQRNVLAFSRQGIRRTLAPGDTGIIGQPVMHRRPAIEDAARALTTGSGAGRALR